MIPFSTFTLANGLRVVHSCDPQSAMCAVVVMYDTGGRDESPELTGIAHLFEHLMFGGSAHVPDFDTQLELAGGNSNAATGSDFTIFYDQLPAQNVETALWLESDRMQALAFSDKALDVQKQVVIEEFKEVCLNRPYGRVSHALLPLIYDKHPYSWPVIGKEPEHIAKVKQDDARAWHKAHYAPNNAILCVVGNLSLERIKELSEKWFGPIPRRETPARHLSQDPWLKEERRAIIYDKAPQTDITIAYRMDAYSTKRYFAADAITDILSAGKSSRLYQQLVVGTDLFTMADASISGSEESGFLLLKGILSKEGEEAEERAIAMLKGQARALAEEGNVTPYELERTKNRYESTFTMENVGLIWRAQNLALATFHGEDINSVVPRYKAISAQDIAQTAKEIFIEHEPGIVICRPQA
ncbi:MAG: insulinase family protein [Clostridium sp.]|nr:insulinase family protein [Clostridium sp.]